MTLGEVSLIIVLVVLAFVSIYVWSGAYESAFAFHAALFVVASGAAAFAIVNRYQERPAEPPPQIIDGKPNYNFAPVKFLSLAAMFWGIAGFTVGLYIALRVGLSRAQSGPALDHVRQAAAAAYVGGDLRIRRQCPARDFVLCRAAHMSRSSGRRSRALVRGARL